MHLFDPYTLRSIAFRNRIGVSPMCQYSSQNGFPSSWHMVHLGSRATGGAGLVFTEAAAVEARGRISPSDLGIYQHEHAEALQPITAFIREQGAVPGIQLAHAGRKASVKPPWQGGGAVPPEEGGWQPIGPSEIAFDSSMPVPAAMSAEEIATVTRSFAQAAHRALQAGFQVVELHAAHGYLLHSFLSPLSNQRADAYGGSFENRTRLVKEIVCAVRKVWPEHLPLWTRISCTDWCEGGWDIEQSVELARVLAAEGVDVIDCSSGGNAAGVHIPVGPGYQTAFAERIRREAGIASAAVGMITSAQQADHLIRTGQADFALLARELLRDPYWPAKAARKLGHKIADAPPQYARAW